MNIGSRQSYIVLACLAYIGLALVWILLSDQWLASIMDLESVVWLSSAKGVFFVLVSGIGFYFVLQGVPSAVAEKAAHSSLSDILAVHRIPRWLTYALAILLIVSIQIVYFRISPIFDNAPLLILFMLPVILAALLGGLGPGLIATFAAAAATAYNIRPVGYFAIESVLNVFHWGLLILNGLTISLISEAMYSSRQREVRRRLQLEKTSRELGASEAQFRRLFQEAPLGMALVDSAGGIPAQNARFEALFGYPKSELNSLADWWPKAYPDPVYREQVKADWGVALRRSAKSKGDTQGREYRVVCKDGSERTVQVYGISLLDGMLFMFLDVTESRKAEQRLKLWTESFERAQVGLIISDAQNNTISSVNPAFAQQRGYSCDEMIGMHLSRLFPAERLEDIRYQLQALNESPHEVFETEHVRKDGRRFPVLIDISVLRNQQQRPINRVAFVIDLTERKRAEQALAAVQAHSDNQQARARLAILNQMQDANDARLRSETALAALKESESRIKLFIDYAPASLAMFDRDMRYLACSRRWLDDYQLGDRELFGLSHYAVFPEISENWKDIHRRGMAGEIIRVDEDRFIRRDGQAQWLRWEVRPWYLEGGEVGGIVIFTEDITARLIAKQALRNSEARLRVLIGTIPDLICLKDLSGVYLLCNPVLEKLIGKREADILGHTDYDLFDAEQADFFRGNDRLALEAAGPVINEEWLTFAEGGYRGLFQTVKTSVANAEGQVIGILAISRDITQLRQAEQNLRAINSNLEARVAERTAELEAINQSLESFVYSVSHDLKAPLRGIEGYSQLLAEDYGQALDDDGRFFIANIRAGVERMGALIDDLLAYSRMERRKLASQRLDLVALVEQALREKADDIAVRDVEIVTDLSPVWVQGDINGLSLALRNLLENALKFSAKTVRPRIEVSFRLEGDNVVVQIADNGIGFDMMYHDQIFEIFQRLHRQEDYPGTGIGLALVRKAMQRMGGSVWAESAPGQGARFYVQLPVARPDE
ncbi:MAG: PAS domain S-box protein [Methylomonas sp.]|jgi:PAS domain S-box-containing protein|uniref:PAS domain S-box protein n=1 Tax=Methylomonas sp. TaxID=418 RepID=UPI0025D40C80|nr:PAS domain S-box protein [Methylomonas sp.]MCK9607914.1 PAS domain S-box protein [Methylomonas sp.]